MPREIGDQLLDFDISFPAIIATSILHHFQFGVIAALPMHREVQLRLRHPTDDLFENCTRKTEAPDFAPEHPKAMCDLMMWLERAERVHTQQRHDKNKPYALHAPEVECIGKGKARKP